MPDLESQGMFGPAGTFSSGTVGGSRPPCREVTSVCSMWCAPTLPEARTDRGWPVSVRPWSWNERGAVCCAEKGAWLPVGLSQEHITVSVLTYIDGPTLVATPDGGGCGRSAHCGLRPAGRIRPAYTRLPNVKSSKTPRPFYLHMVLDKPRGLLDTVFRPVHNAYPPAAL